MDPVQLFLAAIAGGGKLFEGFAGSAAAELQGRIAAGNTALFDKQADTAELGVDVALGKGAFEQNRLRDRVVRVLAGQPGHFIAAGLSPTALSPLVLAGRSAAEGEADLEIIRANTALEVARARAQVANIRGQAAASSYQEMALNSRAFNSRVAGIFGAATSFLTAGKSAFAPSTYGGPKGLY